MFYRVQPNGKKVYGITKNSFLDFWNTETGSSPSSTIAALVSSASTSPVPSRMASISASTPAALSASPYLSGQRVSWSYIKIIIRRLVVPRPPPLIIGISPNSEGTSAPASLSRPISSRADLAFSVVKKVNAVPCIPARYSLSLATRVLKVNISSHTPVRPILWT